MFIRHPDSSIAIRVLHTMRGITLRRGFALFRLGQFHGSFQLDVVGTLVGILILTSSTEDDTQQHAGEEAQKRPEKGVEHIQR